LLSNNCLVKNHFCNVNAKKFCYFGKLDGRDCLFKINTGSDVSIVINKLVEKEEERFLKDNSNLKYPTGEKVPFEGKMVQNEIGKYSFDFPVFVAKIDDSCLLGTDFLKRINLENVFDSFFNFNSEKGEVFNCSRVVVPSEEIPSILKNLYKKSCTNLDKTQKSIFADFLCQFRDMFFQEVVTGNCDIVYHGINVKDSFPIKQAPRRIPIGIRDEVNRIINEMRKQGVIEESQSSWTSLAVLVRKKDGTLRFCVDYRKLNEVTVKDSYPR